MKTKTKKIATKRFKVTKNGKILHRRQNSRHIRASKSKRQKRKYKAATVISKQFESKVRSMLSV